MSGKLHLIYMKPLLKLDDISYLNETTILTIKISFCFLSPKYFFNYVSLKLRFQLITRFVHLDYDVHYDAYVDVTTFEKQDGGEIARDS